MRREDGGQTGGLARDGGRAQGTGGTDGLLVGRVGAQIDVAVRRPPRPVPAARLRPDDESRTLEGPEVEREPILGDLGLVAQATGLEVVERGRAWAAARHREHGAHLLRATVHRDVRHPSCARCVADECHRTDRRRRATRSLAGTGDSAGVAAPVGPRRPDSLHTDGTPRLERRPRQVRRVPSPVPRASGRWRSRRGRAALARRWKHHVPLRSEWEGRERRPGARGKGSDRRSEGRLWLSRLCWPLRAAP